MITIHSFKNSDCQIHYWFSEDPNKFYFDIDEIGGDEFTNPVATLTLTELKQFIHMLQVVAEKMENSQKRD